MHSYNYWRLLEVNANVFVRHAVSSWYYVCVLLTAGICIGNLYVRTGILYVCTDTVYACTGTLMCTGTLYVYWYSLCVLVLFMCTGILYVCSY